MRGRKPKPTHLKLVTGNPGKRPLNQNEPQPARKLPSPPAVLYPEAKREWNRVATELHSLGLLTRLDRAALAAYCQSYGRWVIAERAIAEMAKADPLTHGLIKPTKGGGVPNAMVRTASHAMTEMVRYAGEFGMTPSARSRLSSAPGGDKTNIFSEFG
jgi:P27 family predicted phage terminase small subunit